MPTQVTNYKCPACTGPLHYVGASGKLECDFCGSSYDVAEIEALYAEKEQEAKKAYAREQEKKEEKARQAEKEQKTEQPTDQEASQWDHSSLNTDWGADGDQMQTYTCPSCGAELICDVNTAATSCPYCGNPTVVPGKFDGALKPDYVLPFRLSQEDARKALKEHYKGKRLLPKLFSEENKIKEIRGIYVPFWMFDGKADADVRFDATKVHTYRSGDYRITETSHYDVHRAGWVRFHMIPVDAASKMPDEYMDAIEPFDYKEIREFSTAYLPGFLADKYDVTTEDCAVRAEERMTNSAVEKMEQDVQGYDSCIRSSKQVHLHKGQVHYAMLPVYMLNTRWKDQNYLFAMNGQTGKMVSKLPTSWPKFWGWYAKICLPITAALGTILYFVL